jgi:hypothetical protein
MTTQQVKSTNEAECWATSRMNLYSYLVYDVEAESTTAINTVAITVALADASTFGYFLGPVLGETISARVTMRADPTMAGALPDDGECPDAGGNGNGNGGGGGGGPKK